MTDTRFDQKVAIVGLGGVFPGARSLDEFWQNIREGRDAGRHATADRWWLDPQVCVAAGGPLPDRVYSAWSCLLEDEQLHFPAAVNDQLLRTLDPLFRLGVLATHMALHDAGYDVSIRPDASTGLILGNIALPTETFSALAREQLLHEPLRRQGWVTPPRTNWHPLNRFVAGLPAAVIARSCALSGTCYTLDAACASSLYAIKYACDELLAGRANVMLAGGMSRPDCQYTQMGFAQLQALTKSGRCRPLDARADGLVVGEGAGIFVLKRLGDALADRSRIYGVIAGAGLSNDRSGNLLAPRSEGQLRAMRAAYQASGWSPHDVDLVECHATGTPVGDGVELESLHQLWDDTRSKPHCCVLGGVKSNVGHLLTGAGAAGLMKVLLALQARELPPTANWQHPAGKLAEPTSPFRVLSQVEAWPAAAGRGRRAAVNAFGFGGINAHLLIEESPPSTAGLPPTSPSSIVVPQANGHLTTHPTIPRSEPIAIVGMGVLCGGAHSLQAFQQRLFAGTAIGADEVSLARWEPPLGRFRIPPVELADSLPQQAVMLAAAADALQDAGLTPELGDRAGVYIGLELDPKTTNFHVRWALAKLEHQSQAAWSQHSSDERSAIRDRLSPPLSANRTMGALGGIVASRLAREFGVGGPSHTVSCEEHSGLRALELAIRALERGELETALVGAVDCAADPRSAEALAEGLAVANSDRGFPTDGAAAIVLMRQRDAVQSGRRIYAVLQAPSIGSAESATAILAPELRASATNETDHPDRAPYRVGSLTRVFGDVDAANGLFAVVSTALSVYQEILPPGTTISHTTGSLPRQVQHWLRDRAAGPRQAWAMCPSRTGRLATVHVAEPEPVDRESPCTRPTVPLSLQAQITAERRQPCGPLAAGLFVVAGQTTEHILAELHRLSEMVATQEPTTAIDDVARRWWRLSTTEARPSLRCAVVARTPHELQEALRNIPSILHSGSVPPEWQGRITWSDAPLMQAGTLAYVFPGSGNYFLGMGREFFATWPEVLRQQQFENRELASQYGPELIWNGPSHEAIGRDHKRMIFGQVALGTALCDWLASLNVWPQASLGYSLGESAALFGLRAWVDRDDMLARMRHAELFGSELVYPFQAARKAWNISADQPVEWISGLIDRPAEVIRRALAAHDFWQVSLQIINTPSQCVIGGRSDYVQALVKWLGAYFIAFPAASSVHCTVAREVEAAYRTLHDMPTYEPRGVDFYSTAWKRRYVLSRDSARDAITAQAMDGIDFPAVVETAWRDGVRVFLEIGPGNSCTRMIADILGSRTYRALALCPASGDPVLHALQTLAALLAEGVQVSLDALYGGETHVAALTPRAASTRTIPLQAGIPQIDAPRKPAPTRVVATSILDSQMAKPVPSVSHFAAESLTSPEVALTALEADDSAAWSRLWSTAEAPEPIATIAPPPVPMGAPTIRPVMPAPQSETHRGRAHAVPHGTLQAWLSAQTAVAQAHEDYLRFSQHLQQILLAAPRSASTVASVVATTAPHASPVVAVVSPSVAPTQAILLHDRDRLQPVVTSHTMPLRQSSPRDRSAVPRSLSREECMEFAIGRIGQALGTSFAGADAYPTRVRLPDEPLMLVDRILHIDGEPHSMTSGRVVTEHDVTPGKWYLDCNRIPTCIAVEAGQADLFLSGFLGIDARTKGLAVYRLLDAVVTFHDHLPGPGDTIHYDIRINSFFRQGETWLFRFEFDSTVQGRPLLTMRDGCAGFFSAQELAGGKGIVKTTLDRQPLPGKRPTDWRAYVPLVAESFDDDRVDSLREGDLVSCFGPEFAGLPLESPVTLPEGRMRLFDRVLSLDPTGGRYGLGQIRTEAEIHPDDWFLECHFCDDHVMPGTLMYECCLHTLRFYLLRMGWIGDEGQVIYEPVPGVSSRLKCRGQVIESTRHVWYEVSLKELGYGPDAYCIADALMYADGRPVVEITDMTVRLTGLTRAQLDRTWDLRNDVPEAEWEWVPDEAAAEEWETSTSTEHISSAALPAVSHTNGEYDSDDSTPAATPRRKRAKRTTRKKKVTTTRKRKSASEAALPESSPVAPIQVIEPPHTNESSIPGSAASISLTHAPHYDVRPSVYTREHITAFAIGKPSVAFGDRYRMFDEERRIARLPGPPFQFLDRISRVVGEAWKMQAGGVAEAQYDIPADAWYFAANRQQRMPFAVLLETALQPCGWLSAYVGSALCSESDLSYRNLGGTATLLRDVTPNSGTLTTTVQLTQASMSGGMIIQHFEMDLQCNQQPVYQGKTYFGFFSKESLRNQIGIRDAQRHEPSAAEWSRARRFTVPSEAPFGNERWRMIDQVTGLIRDGGPHGLGFVRGTIDVNPAAWFFQAHFYQDPVWPGSLGLESFLQLVKVFAAERWGVTANTQFSTMTLGQSHEWVYRGQVLPTDKTVTVDVVITKIDDAQRQLTAEGFLTVDGRVIYQMKNFSLQMDVSTAPVPYRQP